MKRMSKMKYQKEIDIANKIRMIMKGKYECSERAYPQIKKIVYNIDSKKWKVTSGSNWKGRKIIGILESKLDSITVSLEDRKNQGDAFYLQIYDGKLEGIGRIGCWLKSHDEDPLFKDIYKIKNKKEFISL